MSRRCAHREDAVLGMVRGRCGGLGLGSRLGHDVEGGTLGQVLWASLALRFTVMGGILGRTRGRSAMRVAFCDAVAGLVLRSVEQTMHPSRAVMPRILCTIVPVATPGHPSGAQHRWCGGAL